MNWKKHFLSSAAVIIVRMIIAFFMFAVVFSSVYYQDLPGGRPEGEELHVPGFISLITWSFAFTYIFIKGYQNRGWMEGVRFGLIVWVFYFIPMLLGYYAYFQLPNNWVIASIVTGLIESIAAGITVALVYKGKIG